MYNSIRNNFKKMGKKKKVMQYVTEDLRGISFTEMSGMGCFLLPTLLPRLPDSASEGTDRRCLVWVTTWILLVPFITTCDYQ